MAKIGKIVQNRKKSLKVPKIGRNGSLRGRLHLRFGCAVWVCVFNVIFSAESSKMTLKTHATVKRTPKLHIQNASVIDP
jgi:hypothetical protein